MQTDLQCQDISCQRTYQIETFTVLSRWSLPMRKIERQILFKIVPMVPSNDSANQLELKLGLSLLLSSNKWWNWPKLKKNFNLNIFYCDGCTMSNLWVSFLSDSKVVDINIINVNICKYLPIIIWFLE